jgi:RHS repeat-associated protein
VSALLAFLLALASSFTSTDAPARAHARPKTRGTLTEVHFFKADDHTRAIATYKPAVESINTAHHGEYERLRFGPRDLAKAERLRAGIGDARVIREGDEVTVFAINHATGYAGMKTVKVPAYSNNAARSSDVVEIVGNIKLFPPEIELTVERQLKPAGVLAAATAPNKIRSGGAATSGDDWLKVGSRWRVRLAAARDDDYVDGGTSARKPGSRILRGGGVDGGFTSELISDRVDAGILETDTSDAGFIDGGPAVPQGVTALVDEGSAGRPLERLCSELDENATPREYLDCLNDETTLTDVPVGVSPIAGRMVHLSGAASTDQLFHIRGGAHEQTLHVARKTTTQTILPVATGVHLLHVVGRPLFRNADTDGDGELSQAEREAGSDCTNVENADGSRSRRCAARIMASDEVLLPGAPDFRDDITLRGFPQRSVAVKALYDARLQAESGGGARTVASYDKTREHRFRVLSVEKPKVEVGCGNCSVEMEQGDTSATATEYDANYTLSLLLKDAEANARPGGRDDWEVRLGGDNLGVACSMKQDGEQLTATCDSEYLPEVVSALDVVYLELFDRTNSDNVLYRFNFFGVSNRVDHVSATTLMTADRATSTLGARYERKNRAPHSRLNEAIFTVDDVMFPSGQGVLEIAVNNTTVRSIDVTRVGRNYVLSPWVANAWQAPVQQLSEPGASFVASMALPASSASLDPQASPEVKLTARRSGHPDMKVILGKPRARLESRAPHAPGHEQVQGIDPIDGRLTFSDVDLDVPERSARVQFVRTYNNQNHEMSSLGLGFTHNHIGFVTEEVREEREGVVSGRYFVVIGGQQLTFPSCLHGQPCASDKSIDGTLTVTEAELTEAERTAKKVPALKAVFEDHGSGQRVTFERAGSGTQFYGRRVVHLSSIDDGMQGDIVYTYEDGTDNLLRVARDGGLLALTFSYDEIDLTDRELHPALCFAVSMHGLKRLAHVDVERTDGTVVDTVVFRHDVPATVSDTCGPSSLVPDRTIKTNILLGACKPQRAPQPEWRYIYETLPSTSLSISQSLTRSNEVKTREFHTEGLHSKWIYGRSSTLLAELPAYLEPQEVVTSVLPPGVDAPYTIESGGHAGRVVTRPDGVKHSFGFSPYGALTSESVGGGIYSSKHENDDEGETIADAKRVLPKQSTSTSGDAVNSDYDAVRHRRTSATQTVGSSATAEPFGGSTRQVTTPTYDSRFAVPTSMTFPGSGAQASATLDVSAFGSVSGMSIDTSTTPVGYEIHHDAHGVPESGTDLTGNSVEWSGRDPRFGQPLTMKITHIANDPNGLHTITRHFAYDDLGRVTTVHENETGRELRRVYDALGRETSSTTVPGHGQANIDTQTTRATAAGVMTTTRRVGGVVRSIEQTDAHQRLQTRRSPFQGGEELETSVYLNNRLQRITSSLRNSIREFSYNARGAQTLEAETVDGLTTSMVYVLDGNDNLVSTTSTDPLGRTTVTTMDKLGRPSRVNYGSSGDGDDVVDYLHDVPGNLVRESFGNHVFQTIYDAVGRVTERKSTSSTAVRETFTHDRAGRVVSTSSEPSELTDAYEWNDVLGRMTKHTRTVHTVDVQGDPTTLTVVETRAYHDTPEQRTVTITETASIDVGERTKTTTLFLDGLDRIIRVDEVLPDASVHRRTITRVADGMTETQTDDATGLVTTNRYDQQGALVSSSNAEQNVAIAVDSVGSPRRRTTTNLSRGDIVMTETFDAFGRPTRRELAGTNEIGAHVTTWTYDAAGHTETETPPAGAAPVVRTSNARGLLLREEQGPVTTTMHYDGPWLKQRQRVEGNNNTIESIARDDAGRPTLSTESWALTTSGAIPYTYTTSTDWTGRTANISETWSSGGRSESRTSTQTLDSLGNVALRVQAGVRDLQITDAVGRPLLSGSSTSSLTRTTVVAGLPTLIERGGESTSMSYDLAGRLLTTLDPLGHTVTNTYTPAGVLSQRVTKGFSHVVEQFDGAGFPTSKTVGVDAEASTWTYSTGPGGELLSVTQPTNETYRYGYAADRKLTSLTSPGGVAQSWAYADALRRPTLRQRGSATWTTTWNEHGTSTTTDPLSNRVETVFDGRGRTAKLTALRANNDVDERSTFSYEGTDQPLQVLHEMAGRATTTTTYGYDGRSRVTSIARTGQPTVNYSYFDGVGTSSTTRTLSGTTQTKVLDGLGRVSSIVNSAGPTLALAYLPGGLLDTITNGAVVVEDRDYDGRKQVSRIALAAGTADATTYAYGYDTRGNRLTETLGVDVTRYAYDRADRLTGVRYPDGKAEVYKLRGDGARLQRKSYDNYPSTTFAAFDDAVPGAVLSAHTQWSFDARDGLSAVTDLLSSSTSPVTTDAAGRVVQQGTRAFTWSVRDRLLTVVDNNDQTTTYDYNFQGLRVRTSSDVENRSYVWGASALEAEGPTAGALAMHTSAAGLRLAVGDEVFGHDVLGSVVVRLPASGIATKTAYDAWGAVRGTPSTGPPRGLTGDRVGFTGHSNEPTGLAYAQQRWLDPASGRFLSLDPVAGSLDEPLTTQGFTYVSANPTKYTDPDGRCLATAAAGALIGGGLSIGRDLLLGNDVNWTAAAGRAVFGAAMGCGVGALVGVASGTTAFAGAAGAAVTGLEAGGTLVATAGATQRAVVIATAEHDDPELKKEALVDTLEDFAVPAVVKAAKSAKAVAKAVKPPPLAPETPKVTRWSEGPPSPDVSTPEGLKKLRLAERMRSLRASEEGKPSVDPAGTLNSDATKRPGEGFQKYSDGDGKGGIYAEVDDEGMLVMAIMKSDQTPPGHVMFKEALAAFGSHVKGVRGLWGNGGDLKTNFDLYKAAIAKGMSPPEAAFETKTGQWARDAGFRRAVVTKDTDNKVEVDFVAE